YKQDIRFMLTHGSTRKWLGVDKIHTLNGPKSTNITFHTNHVAEEQTMNSNSNPVSKQWFIIKGTTTHDDDIQLQIGAVIYTVTFSKTANGSDFMTLNYFKNERLVTQSFYSE